ncbi:uncharacterized protein VTP21DRAFT_1097 [Calcarisporiella thermophila]|uniref:uncharacterized protein n=1 Tax=Calcarisporiella thermophila TaxID=911321 RepID=UPI003742BB5F
MNEASQSRLVFSALMCAIISDLENSLPGIIAGKAAFNAPRNAVNCLGVVKPALCNPMAVQAMSRTFFLGNLRDIFRVSMLNPKC